MRTIKRIESFFLIMCLFFVTYQKLFATSVLSYMDELLLGLLFLFELFARQYKQFSYVCAKVVRYTVYAGTIYIILSLIATLMGSFAFSTQQTNGDMITAIINAMKIYILLLTCLLLNFSTAEIRKWIIVCLVMALPSVVYSVIQYIQYYVLGIHLKGHYDIIDEVWFYRIQGFAYHPVGYGNQLALMALMTIYLMKKKKYLVLKICMFVVFSILCYLTRTEYAYVMLAVSVVVLLIVRCRPGIRRVLVMLLIGAGIVAVVVLLLFDFNLLEWIFAGEESTIRYKSIIGSTQLLFNQNLLGYGWGSYAYYGFGEAGLFRIFFDSGILGGIIYMMPFICLFVNLVKLEKRLPSIILLLFFLGNASINEIYTIPGIFYIFILATDINMPLNKKAPVLSVASQSMLR